MRNLRLLLVFIFLINLSGIVISYSCTDYDGLRYSNPAGAEGYNESTGDYWQAPDYCDGDYIMETYCKGGEEEPVRGEELAYDRYLCEYGCVHSGKHKAGYCLSAPKVCADISQEVKDKVVELQGDGKNVSLMEGEFLFDNEYLVVAQNGYSRILELKETRRGGIKYKRDTTKFMDVISGEEFEFEGESGTLVIDEQEYHIITTEGYNITKREGYEDHSGDARLTWGEEANSERAFRHNISGNEITISCPYECESGICLECGESWECTDWTDCAYYDLQTRNCTDSNNCGTIDEKPSESRECVFGEDCEEDWECSDWRECISNIKKRDCVDLNDCGTNYDKPLISKICVLEIFIKDVNVVIEKDSDGLSTLKTENNSVKSSLEIVTESQKVYIKTDRGNKQIKFLPEEAISKSKIKDVNEIKIEGYEGEVVYAIAGTTKAKLFFIFPITAKIETKVNVETGQIVYTKKPWWSFLAVGI